MDKAVERPLGEVAEIIMGQSPASESYNEKGEGIPFYQGKSDFGEVHPTVRMYCKSPKKMAAENDILMSVRAPVGDVNIARETCCIGRGLAAIRSKEAVHFKYLFYLLDYCKERLAVQGTGTTFKAIGKDVLTGFPIPVWDRSVQQAIVSMLDELYRMISNRNQAIYILDELVKSRFVEMFGDPMTNSKNYPLTRYGEIFELNAGGTPSKQVKEYWNEGTISWIGSNMCHDEVIYQNDGQYITEEGLKHSSAKIFPINTVLIALVGATIGKTALLKFETATNQNVIGVRNITESGYTPEFVFYYTQGIYDKFLNVGGGKFSMASKGFISELEIPRIDLCEQQSFSNFVQQVDKSKFAVQGSIDTLQTLKAKLMQEYFG